MKTLFTSILILFAIYQSYAIPIFNSFYGSVLCDTLSTTYALPEELQGRYDYTTTVIKSDIGNYLEIQYHLTSSDADSVKQITTNLYKYFKTDQYPPDGSQSWRVSHNIYINGTRKEQAQPPALYFGYPFEDCYTTTPSCNEIKVYRKTLRPICPENGYFLKTSNYVSNDSLIVMFRDSIVPYANNCMIVGHKVYTDSITVNNLKPTDYKIIAKEEYLLNGVAGFQLKTIYHRIDTADLSNCIVSGYDKHSLNKTRLYPNPASSTINIPELEGEIQITNQLGQHFILKGNERFDISNLKTGLYLISYEIKGIKYKEKLIIR
jgi:hypothetical protein